MAWAVAAASGPPVGAGAPGSLLWRELPGRTRWREVLAAAGLALVVLGALLA